MMRWRICRQRCWKYDWVIDLDLRAFFDSLDHSLVLKAVAHHTEPAVDPPLRGAVAESAAATRGRHPQATGSREPAGLGDLARAGELFLHYALDMWLRPGVPGRPVRALRGRCDPALQDPGSKRRVVLDAIIERLAQVGLELNLDKTRIVYCKDSNRTGSHEHEQFTFLGYTFRPRLARNRSGEFFVSFCPAVSDDAAKTIRHSDQALAAALVERADPRRPRARRSTRSCEAGSTTTAASTGRELVQTLRRINEYLVRWAMRKYKRLRSTPQGRGGSWRRSPQREPNLFAHWTMGAQPTAG